jgi:hypothetical protein
VVPALGTAMRLPRGPQFLLGKTSREGCGKRRESRLLPKGRPNSPSAVPPSQPVPIGKLDFEESASVPSATVAGTAFAL